MKGIETVAYRVNRIAKTIKKEQLPLERRHADLFYSPVNQSHLLSKHWVDFSSVKDLFLKVNAGVAGSCMFINF